MFALEYYSINVVKNHPLRQEVDRISAALFKDLPLCVLQKKNVGHSRGEEG